MSKIEMNRRNFLKLGLASSGFLIASAILRQLPVNGKTEKEIPSELSFSEIANFTLLMDTLHSALSDYTIPMDTNEDLQNWVKEIVPHFERDGFVKKAIYPDAVRFQDMHTYVNRDLKIYGKDPLNVEAFTTCENTGDYDPTASTLPLPIRRIYINDRIIQPESAEYHTRNSLVRLVHELGHVEQGSKCLYDNFIGRSLETSAQEATIEVLACMALQGNKFALFSLVDFLREIGMNAAKFKGLSDPKFLPQYQSLVSQVYRKPSEEAMLEETNMGVKGLEKEHSVFLEVYNYEPLKNVLLAHKYGHDVINNLEFQIPSVIFDRFGYFIDHAQTLIAEYADHKSFPQL